VVAEYKYVGGIRIEDDVLITQDGCRVLSNLPRSVEEIESFMDGGDWNIDQQDIN